MADQTAHDPGSDEADLARFGYKQELKRSLGVFSSFAVAFSYISPSTGIFTLFALGLTTIGGVFILTWPVVAAGQFIIALNFAEVTSHYPIAGAVFQWTKYLARRGYAWFIGVIDLAIFHNHQGVHVITNSAGLPVNTPTFLAAMFMSLFVIYGFDTASTLAEETRDPRRAAPKAVLYAVIGAFIIGGVFLFGTLIAIPERLGVKGAMAANGGLGLGPAQIIDANFSTGFATLYLLVVAAAIFVCCLSIMASTIRLCFGMSRDNTLPFSKPLAKVSPSLHTPVWTCIVIAVIAAIPFLQFSGAGTIAIAATGMIYLSYFLGNVVILAARTRGWPKTKAPFRLGRW